MTGPSSNILNIPSSLPLPFTCRSHRDIDAERDIVAPNIAHICGYSGGKYLPFATIIKGEAEIRKANGAVICAPFDAAHTCLPAESTMAAA